MLLKFRLGEQHFLSDMCVYGQSTTLMECTWHVLLCVLEELLPPVELWPCWEERGNLAAVA